MVTFQKLFVCIGNFTAMPKMIHDILASTQEIFAEVFFDWPKYTFL